MQFLASQGLPWFFKIPSPTGEARQWLQEKPFDPHEPWLVGDVDFSFFPGEVEQNDEINFSGPGSPHCGHVIFIASSDDLWIVSNA